MSIGIHEAILLATQARLIEHLPSLNSSLARSPIVTTTAVTSGYVVIGQPEWLPDAPVLICVQVPEEHSTMRMEEIAQGYGMYPQVRLFVVGYLHPDYMAYTSVPEQVKMERIGLARMADWIRACWIGSDISMPLASAELSSPDVATGYVTSIETYLSDTGADGSLIAPTVAALLEFIVS